MKNKKKAQQNKNRHKKRVESSIKKIEEPCSAEEPTEIQEIEIMPIATAISTIIPTKVEEKETDENQNCKMPTSMAVLTPTMPARPVSPTQVDAPPDVPEVIKHPLENTWGFWLFTNENKKNWTENQKELTMFHTVEDYWCLYHHMKLPSELRQGQDYAVFKQGISPMWEDGANRVGGRWFINLDKKGSAEMDRIWLDVVLLLIGENFQNSDVICGAVVNVRPKNRVSVWTRNKEEAANMEVGKKLKETLRIHFRLQYLDHKTNSILYYV